MNRARSLKIFKSHWQFQRNSISLMRGILILYQKIIYFLWKLNHCYYWSNQSNYSVFERNLLQRIVCFCFGGIVSVCYSYRSLIINCSHNHCIFNTEEISVHVLNVFAWYEYLEQNTNSTYQILRRQVKLVLINR